MINRGKQWARELSRYNRMQAELKYGLISYADVFMKYLKGLGEEQ
jgi:hypothetical protein